MTEPKSREGTQFGPYRLLRLIGKGGMGRVYRGEHTGIGRAVAIKVLHPDLGKNKEASQRFQREAIASGRLDHPNIVGVSDFGVLEDGCPYLVMEVLEGEELGKRLERAFAHFGGAQCRGVAAHEPAQGFTPLFYAFCQSPLHRRDLIMQQSPRQQRLQQ